MMDVVTSDRRMRLASLVFYELFVRSHGPNGTFAEIEADLLRIRQMGVDVILLMPVHSIGVEGRKGERGSPYAVRDYFEVHPDYGSSSDLSRLIDAAHAHGLRIILDVVLNHSARDCPLRASHPEWYGDGQQNTLPEWTDVLPFDHGCRSLSEYFFDVLAYWARFGFDGFRCDAASLVPLDFWVEARQRVSVVKRDLLWLAEGAHPAYVAERRAANLPVLSDSELCRAFDLTYDADALPVWRAVIDGRLPLIRYAEMLRLQDGIYPTSFVKLRFVENHDQPAIVDITGRSDRALAWTAFQAFNQGAFLIHAGQENGAGRYPSLFESGAIDWRGYPLQPFLTALALLKKDAVMMQAPLVITQAVTTLQGAREVSSGGLYGIFDVSAYGDVDDVALPDGVYKDVLSGEVVSLQSGRCSLPGAAAILKYDEPIGVRPFHTDFLDLPAAASASTSR
jgi:hypothetical protein